MPSLKWRLASFSKVYLFLFHANAESGPRAILRSEMKITVTHQIRMHVQTPHSYRSRVLQKQRSFLSAQSQLGLCTTDQGGPVHQQRTGIVDHVVDDDFRG